MMNPFGISGSWRIDPDNRQDRGSSKCITRKMTEEEKLKYGISVESEGRDMKALNIDVNKMVEICRLHGTGTEGVKAVAKEFGLTDKQAENQIFLKKIRRLLEAKPQTLEEIKERPLVPKGVDPGKVKTPKVIPPQAPPEVKNILSEPESEVLDKIKAIVAENKQLKAVYAENEVLREKLVKVEILLKELLTAIS